MDCNKYSQLAAIAEGTGVFKSSEITVLGEVLALCGIDPAKHYILFEETALENVVGFAIIGRTPCTGSTWDIYWLVVDKAHAGKGAAVSILQKAENYILARQSEAVIRIETSSREEYARARGFYNKSGFAVSGLIHDFYAKEDNLIIYSKKITSKNRESHSTAEPKILINAS
ncbi:MAG: GNAT family N-acetyltransferase [Candidatus Omnitrophica bacterium]|nr:GNAT family N-acetyltransferase [Candidatus Omnitrophota bacterium]